MRSRVITVNLYEQDSPLTQALTPVVIVKAFDTPSHSHYVRSLNDSSAKLPIPGTLLFERTALYNPARRPSRVPPLRCPGFDSSHRLSAGSEPAGETLPTTVVPGVAESFLLQKASYQAAPCVAGPRRLPPRSPSRTRARAPLPSPHFLTYAVSTPDRLRAPPPFPQPLR